MNTLYNFARLLMALAMLTTLGIQPAADYTATASLAPQAAAPRRVNIPYFSGDVSWAESAVFWFGVNEQGIPSPNYLDVRMGYTPVGLRVRVTVVDYYLWYKENAQPGDDLTQYDAVALFLDTDPDQASAPQSDDYLFLAGVRWWEDTDNYGRDAQGTGSNWNLDWEDNHWSFESGGSWNCNPGFNSNSCGIDYGWTAIYTLPWSTFGLSGRPADDTVWGLGVVLYDRDDNPPAGAVSPQYWPEDADPYKPSTWGELHFGEASYLPPPVSPGGVTTIRATSQTDNTVEDAWMGGGGTCSGGHEGGSETNHGNSTDLYVGSETAATHFPCYNKSYLRFSLDAVPPGKVILSAMLTLHHWGNASGDQSSLVHLYSITDPWNEMTIHWNNAPLAQENIYATWVDAVSSFPGWPGNPYTWDASKAVAEAYNSGQAVGLAIYSSDSERDSSKYLTASETGDWNIEGRPTLIVTWGSAPTTLSKQANPTFVSSGDGVDYLLEWVGTGAEMSLTDTLPSGLSAPSGLVANVGSASYNPTIRQITWEGTPTEGQKVTLTYQVTVEVDGTIALRNTAVLTGGDGSSSASAQIVVNGYVVSLPIVFK